VTAKGGDLGGEQEEGQEGGQEKEVVSVISTLGAAPPQRHLYYYSYSGVFVKVRFDNFFNTVLQEVLAET
jgi:hypothetical protein